MAFEKITDEDLVGIGVIGLPDTPGLSTEDMQEKFEETARSVVIPKFNQAMDELPEVRTGALASFPRPGTPGKIYVDTTAIPALMYMWDADLEEYVPAGGTGGGTGGGGYDTTVSVPASGWAGDAAPYSQEVTATGMTANMAVVLAQVTSSAVATDAEKEAFSLISGYAQDEDSVTFYAAEKPDTDLRVRIFSGGGGEGGGTDYSMISDEFSDKRPYSIGERCIFKNTLWKFTADKPAGAWDSTKVESTTVDAELAELRGKVDELNSRIDISDVQLTGNSLLKNVVKLSAGVVSGTISFTKNASGWVDIGTISKKPYAQCDFPLISNNSGLTVGMLRFNIVGTVQAYTADTPGDVTASYTYIAEL